jgi:hypothetical protein
MYKSRQKVKVGILLIRKRRGQLSETVTSAGKRPEDVRFVSNNGHPADVA